MSRSWVKSTLVVAAGVLLAVGVYKLLSILGY